MEERTWSRGHKQTYTDRPLTEEERRFAENPENYKKIYEFMNYYRLDEDEWYDILIIPYLQAVKKYHVREDLRSNYRFYPVLNLMLSKAIFNHNRDMNRKKRRPVGGICSLDYVFEGDNQYSEHRIEELWIDQSQQLESDYLYTEMYAELMSVLTEQQRRIVELLVEGYKQKEIAAKLFTNQTAVSVQIREIRRVTKVYLSH